MAFVEITVEIRNAEAEKARILQTGKIVQTGLQVAVEKIAAYIQSAAQGICPVRTGFLRGSIIILMGNRIAVISATAPYAEFVEYGCFLSQSFKVLTKRGWCQYRHLQVGDEVLTHKMRWRKVTDKFKHVFSSKIPHFKIKTETGKTIIVTPNHPVLTTDGWKPAEQIKLGESIYVVKNDLPRFHWKNFMAHNPLKGRRIVNRIVKVCTSCGKRFEIVPSRLKYHNPSYKWYCSQECSFSSRRGNQCAKGKHWKLTEKQKERHRGQNNSMFNKNRKHYYSEIGYRDDLGHKTKSTWEANYCRILNHLRLKYEYEPESFILPDGSTYTPDIKVNGKYVEIKGYMTNSARRKIAQFKQSYSDKQLTIIDEANYERLVQTYRSKIAQWEDGSTTITGRDLKMLTERVVSVSHSFTHPRNTVYNFSVDEDQSYVANGIVTHNTSRMAARAFMRSAEGIGAGMADLILAECVRV